MNSEERLEYEEQNWEETQDSRYEIRLPGFISNEDVGLGDLIKRATRSIGISPCGGCSRRAEAINRLVRISGRHEK